MAKLTAFALNCSLKSSSDEEKSSTDKMIADLLAALARYEVTGEVVRAADHDIKPGVMYLLNGHEHHTLRAHTDVKTVCVFNPPCTGREVHDENGVYPLLTEEDA